MGIGRIWPPAVLALVTACSLASCTTVVPGTATTASFAGADAQGLAALLPSADEIADILRTPPLALDHDYTTMPVWDISVADPTCMSAVANTVTAIYDGSRFVEVHGVVLQEAGEDALGYDIDPAAVRFGNPADAAAFVERISAQWQACTGTSVSYTEDGTVRTWQIGDVEERDGVWSTASVESPYGWTCARAVGSVSDVVADVRACGYELTEGADELAADILSRVAAV